MDYINEQESYVMVCVLKIGAPNQEACIWDNDLQATVYNLIQCLGKVNAPVNTNPQRSLPGKPMLPF